MYRGVMGGAVPPNVIVWLHRKGLLCGGRRMSHRTQEVSGADDRWEDDKPAVFRKDCASDVLTTVWSAEACLGSERIEAMVKKC